MERHGSRLSRRQFVGGATSAGLLAGATALLGGCAIPGGPSQPSSRRPRIGVLGNTSSDNAHYMESFWQGMREHGYIDGQNIVVEQGGQGSAQGPEAARAMVQLPVDLLFAIGPSAPIIAHDETTSIPIVMVVFSGDAVASGLVASLGRPGGNVTGLTSFLERLNPKRLELLRGTVSGLSHVAVLQDANFPPRERELRDLQDAARTLEVTLHEWEVRGPEEFDSVFAGARGAQAQALFLGGGMIFFANRPRLIALADQYRLPTMYWRPDFVRAGGLMSYAPNIHDQYRRAAYYVDRILKGTKPADLPVEQPMTFDFVVNLKTARELGITFPNEIMLQVTEVIQ
jgi:putative tryptophan/tyrosine transport system substrate-binding protein